MKIDLAALKILEKAGASVSVIMAAIEHQIEVQEAKRKKRRPNEAAAKRRKRADKVRTDGGHEAESGGHGSETDGRGRLFGLVRRLMDLGLADAKARSILGQWAKITHDNIEAIERAIGSAEVKRPADAIGYIRACLQERNTINGTGSPVMDAADRLIAATAPDEFDLNTPMRDITPRS